MSNGQSQRARYGLTLIEVIASTALLATTLIGVLVAFSNIEQQNRLAEKRIEAVELADEMLYRWSVNNLPIPADQTGKIPGETWYWKTSVVQESKGTHLQQIRFEIFDRLPAKDDSERLLVLVLPHHE